MNMHDSSSKSLDPRTIEARSDIGSRHDITRLVDSFYQQVRADALLGPIFDDVARVDWAAHLPKMYDFWESVLLGTANFKGNPLAAHRALAKRTPLTAREFSQWVRLFHETVDRLFDGPIAGDAKLRAARIAVVMQHHIQMDAAVEHASTRV